MKLTVIGKQISVYDDTKELIAEKLQKLDRYFGGEGEAVATLSRKHGTSTLEITISAANTLFRSEVDAESFRDALDKSVDNIERQIRKNKTRLQKRLRPDTFEPVSDETDDYGEEQEFIVRTKEFDFKPMSVEEAIMQMNLLGHQFFVFIDDESEKTCVVYKRYDGTYGLILPRK